MKGLIAFSVLVAAVLIYELATIGHAQTGGKMPYAIRHPFASFKGASKKKKASVLSLGALFLLGGTALAFYLFSITGTGSGTTGIDGAATQPNNGQSLNEPLRVVFKDGIKIGGSTTAGIWFAKGDTQLDDGYTYDVQGITTSMAIYKDAAATTPDDSCKASWFSVSDVTPNKLWGTDGNANDGPGSGGGAKFPEVFSVKDSQVADGGYHASFPGLNGAVTYDGSNNLVWTVSGTDPDWAIGKDDGALDPTADQDDVIGSNAALTTASYSSTDFTLGTVTVSMPQDDADNQNACDGDTFKLTATMSGTSTGTNG